MDWLSKLPVVGPWVARTMRTHAWHSYETLERVHWTRLAAAITFISFLAMFPLITVAIAIGAALLSQDQLTRLEDRISEQVPGISDQLDIAGLVANAGTVGLVAGALLLFTGIGWIGAMRDCLRAVWRIDDEDRGNPFVKKAEDAVVLLGLGGTALASLAASTLGSSAVGWTAELFGIERSGAGAVLLRVAAIAIAVVANFLMLLYLLTLLPGVHPPRRRLVVAGLIGAVGFELLKLLIGGYIREVAGRSVYGAFGVPVALLLWMNFTAKLLLFCAAWTATKEPEEEPSGDDEDASPDGTGETGEAGRGEVESDAAGRPDPTTSGAPPRPAPVDDEHRTREDHQDAAGDRERRPDAR
ncbi:YhjD/YihY/BrkB family envelope integrity protein [Streptomyces sp. NPDC048057]|uniref:YihY/virulence factor BrkB family protein n=1 Tax=Streptomyces sp. NPDC048057 TaxID=3155628 RepID=UPI0033C2C127